MSLFKFVLFPQWIARALQSMLCCGCPEKFLPTTRWAMSTYERNCLFVSEQIKKVHGARTRKNCRRKVMNTSMENKYPPYWSSSLIKKVQEPRYKGPCIERSGYNDPSHIIPTSVYIVHDVFKFVSLIRFHYFSHAWTADKSFCTSSWFYYTAAS